MKPTRVSRSSLEQARRRRPGGRRPAVLLAALLATAAAAAAPAPRIACDEPVLHFGELPTDREDLAHTFVLRNDGDVTLKIGEVDEHCGCTDLRLSSRILRPGETATLSVRFSVRGRRGDVEKFLLVHSNDPAHPVLKLGFEGSIEPDATVTPMSILLGTVSPSQAASGSVVVAFPATAPGRVREVVSDSPLFRGSFEELEPGRRYRVHATTVPPLATARRSYLRATLRVLTERPRSPEILVPVVAMVMDDVIVAPAEIFLPAGEPGPLTRYVTIRPGRVHHFRVLEVEAPDPAVRAEIGPLGEGGYRIRLDHLRATAELDGRPVRIRTDLPAHPVFEVPLRVLPARSMPHGG